MTHRQELFIQEYIKTGNVTSLAIKAGYSKRTARSIGQENLTKPYIKKRIEELS